MFAGISLNHLDLMGKKNRFLNFHELGQLCATCLQHFSVALTSTNSPYKCPFRAKDRYNSPDGIPYFLVANGRVFAEIRSELPGNPDGMKVDVEGNLYVAARARGISGLQSRRR